MIEKLEKKQFDDDILGCCDGNDILLRKKEIYYKNSMGTEFFNQYGRFEWTNL